MKRLLILLLLASVATACSSVVNPSTATEPPLNFPTILPDSSRLCQSSDLETSSNYNGDTGATILGVTLTNIDKNPCKLTNPPQPSLLDTHNKPLDLQIVDITSVQNPPAASIIEVGPAESVIITLIWSNYCQESEINTLTLRLVLSNGQNLDIPINQIKAPECKEKNGPSKLIVVPYSVPP